MRYFIDTEYDWNPSTGKIIPISIALIREDDHEYYAVSDYCRTRKFREECSRFVFDHVLPIVAIVESLFKPMSQIRSEIREFIGDDTPEFWGEYAAFDYVVLSMVMGEFSDWPEGWPMWINDMKQDAIPELPSSLPHHALVDARAIRDAWNHAFQVTA